MRSRSWSKSRIEVNEGVPGFMPALHLNEKTVPSVQLDDLPVFLGGSRDQVIPQRPEYPAGSAGHIPLYIGKSCVSLHYLLH